MDIERFRVVARREEASVVPPPPPPPRQRQTRPFLRGPVPLWWLARAADTCAAALSVGVCLWFMRGVMKQAAPIKVTRSVLRRLNLSRDQSGRGLRALEKAGLIRFVVSGRGRCPVVEILVDESGLEGDVRGPTMALDGPEGAAGRESCESHQH
jgi:hypothetical protein